MEESRNRPSAARFRCRICSATARRGRLRPNAQPAASPGEQTTPISCALAMASSSPVVFGLGRHFIGAEALGSHACERRALHFNAIQGVQLTQGMFVPDVFATCSSDKRIRSGVASGEGYDRLPGWHGALYGTQRKTQSLIRTERGRHTVRIRQYVGCRRPSLHQ